MVEIAKPGNIVLKVPARGSCLWSSLDRGYWPQISGRVLGKMRRLKRHHVASDCLLIKPGFVGKAGHVFGGVTGTSALARNLLWAKCDD